MIDTKMFLLSKEFSEGRLPPEPFKKELSGGNWDYFLLLSLKCRFISEFTIKLNDVINILTLMGVSSPFEQMILTKSSQLGKVCKELTTLDICKPFS